MKNRVNGKRRGRPAGAPTRYPGITRFAAWYGCSHQFARQVLDGGATSRPLMEAWGEWQAMRQ